MSMRSALPEIRRPKLRAALAEQRPLSAIECHSPLAAIVAQQAVADHGNGLQGRFDALWVSGYASSTVMGLPDTELFLHEDRMQRIASIVFNSSLPIIVDGDTGGEAAAFGLLCQRLEILGVSAVVVEDKTGQKRTSLASDVTHVLEDPETFVAKIDSAHARLGTPDFMIFARTEALIAGLGVAEALRRARRYLLSSADGVLIHSKDRSGTEILEFLAGYAALCKELCVYKPAACVPTAYHHMTSRSLFEAGARIVIYGNHLVRASYRGMQQAAQSILMHDRSLEADAVCAPVNELLQTIGVE
jgi:2-methylisocitrate lyase-like PEP mutase family enzyme